MITLKIIDEELPPEEWLGSTLYQEEIIIGPHSSCHFIVRNNDEEEGRKIKHLATIKFHQLDLDQVYLTPNTDISLKINHKKIFRPHPIKKNDTIHFASCDLLVAELDPTKVISSLDHLKLQQEFIKEQPQYKNVLTAIQKEMLYHKS